MPKHCRIHVPGENRLLVALPKDEYDRLLPHLEKVSLPLRDILYEANGPIAHVFFPLVGVVSLVIMNSIFTLEVGIIGNGGIVGTPVFLGFDRSPTKAIVQIPGEALRMEAKVFQKEMGRGGPLHGLVQRSRVFWPGGSADTCGVASTEPSGVGGANSRSSRIALVTW